ncbi:MAG: S-methyl-5'-thioadenosine phosphorylase [Acidobacteria bacterium]|jgi:5'-methylthioadenosine phosphorylase|nr:MAG: S-methyl-5'-thioadenosine phosphorylase [Acidobacteriota bacterium]
MIGIIGGSGLYEIESLKVVDRLSIDTPFGEPSSEVVVGELNGRRVCFLSRHGKGHVYPPHLVPYRANLWALRKLGVSRVLAFSAVGAINRRFEPGDFVIVDDLLDFTKGRESTYYEGKFSLKVEDKDRVGELLNSNKVVHIDSSQLYCPQMRSLLAEVLEDLKLTYHPSGVYACTEGPRFETPAEIRAIERLGGDVVGMTGYPEVVLARELTMCYASLCVVSNPAAGIARYRLTSEEVISLMKKKEEEIRAILVEFIRRVPQEKTCGCDRILDGAQV